MAIQNRRGIYSDFDPTKMVEGEFAVVQSGDPDTIDGKAVYISTQTGSVERLALYKDITQAVSTAIDEVTEDVIEDINEGVAENVEKAETAADNAEASAEEAAEILENKADIDGTYDNLVAGNLLSDETQTDSAPYLFRPTGGGLQRIGERCYPVLVGASVAENQLCNGESVTVPNGHKYYLKKSGTESLGASTGSAITGLTSGSDMVIDLTQKFGSTIADYIYQLETATAGSGIAWLRSYGFLKGYQAFNAGSIESVEVTGKVVVGKNLIDVNDNQIIAGYINSNGVISSSSTWSTSPLIMIDPSKAYVLSGLTSHPNTNTDNYRTYDASQNYIGNVRVSVANYPVQFNSDVRYVQFSWKNTEKDTVMFSFADAGDEYEPYKSTTYSLGSDTLRGIFKLADGKIYADGDRKEADGTITRKMKSKMLEQVDVTYSLNNSGYSNIAYARITKPSDAKGRNSAAPLLILLEGYVTSSATSGWDTADKIGYLFYGADAAYWWVGFSHGTTIEQMKTALAGKELIYELATPTTEQSTPFTSPQICYPDGTEEFVTENGVPVGHETAYPYDLKALVEGLIDVPDVPSANGTYVLKATRSASGIVYNWVSE